MSRRGSFRSATVARSWGRENVQAGTLVAAAGGFEANIEWLKDSWGPAADNFVIRGTPYNRGSVLKALLGKGVAAVGDPVQCHAVAVDARAPKFDGGIITRLDCVVFGIVVNKYAQRFYDEGEDIWPKRYAIWGRLVAGQPDQIAYIVFDASSLELFMPSLFPPVAAGTIGELGAKLGLDPDALEGTIKRFNEAVRPGRFDPNVLDDCRTEGLVPAKTHWARRIETPPFYAYPVRPGITFTYLGLRVDRQRAHGHGRRAAIAQHVRRRRDHGRQCPRERICRRNRHDDRKRLRADSRPRGGKPCPQLTISRKPTA